ncbi:MAG: hypothetical protein WC750_00865 [Patescibacteria group bacterium]
MVAGLVDRATIRAARLLAGGAGHTRAASPTRTTEATSSADTTGAAGSTSTSGSARAAVGERARIGTDGVDEGVVALDALGLARLEHAAVDADANQRLGFPIGLGLVDLRAFVRAVAGVAGHDGRGLALHGLERVEASTSCPARHEQRQGDAYERPEQNPLLTCILHDPTSWFERKLSETNSVHVDKSLTLLKRKNAFLSRGGV